MIVAVKLGGGGGEPEENLVDVNTPEGVFIFEVSSMRLSN